MTRIVLLAGLAFVGSVGVHLILTRLIHGRGYVRNAYLLFCVVCLVSFLPVLGLGLLGAIIFYTALAILWNLYIIFFINLMNSVSLRMMTEIARSPGRVLAWRNLSEVYSDEEALEARLRSLVDNGFLLDRGGEGLLLTPRGRLLAHILQAWRAFFGIESFG